MSYLLHYLENVLKKFSCNYINTGTLFFVPIVISLFGLFFSFFKFYQLKQLESGEEREREISEIIKNASLTYLKEQYKAIFVIVFVFMFLIKWLLGNNSLIGFFLGAIFSCLAGFFSMYVSLNSNVRTTTGARDSLGKAFYAAFTGGQSAGLFINSLGLLFLSGSISFFFENQHFPIMNFLLGFSFGASLVCVFARIGGGIFTKGADVGADLVGKVESSLPEDDPRNPAVIADNVGDNVGDCAGMAADIFESYCVTIFSCFGIMGILKNEINIIGILLPLLICSAGILGSIFGNFFISKEEKNPWKSLTKYFYLSVAFCFLFCILFLSNLSHGHRFFIEKGVVCIIIGLLTVIGLLKITEYYTSTEFSPVREIAESSQGGGGTNVIYGLSYSFSSVFLPTILVVFGIMSSFTILGLSGIAITVASIISLSPSIMTLDIYGPITDNAGGIGEMANLPEYVRDRTDILDKIGNTTKALTKGYAIGSASFASILLFVMFLNDVEHINGLKIICDLAKPEIFCGLMIGCTIPFLFSGLGMKSVGKAGSEVVKEVRNQIRERPGIIDGTEKPDYDSTIRYLTKTAINEMVLPTLVPIFITLGTFFLSQYYFNKEVAITILSSVMMGCFLGGVFLSTGMTIAGGAWDNAKKYIEGGVYGGKGSPTHKAAVIGDTVGDPYKDTVGPALNAVIKLVNLIGLLILFVIK